MNANFSELRSQNEAIGGMYFRQLFSESTLNADSRGRSPDGGPLLFGYRDEGIGIDAATVDRTTFTTTTRVASGLFDFKLGGFAAIRGILANCGADGDWAGITPNSISIDPNTGEAFFDPAVGDVLSPETATLGGISADSVCRPLGNEVIADVLLNPDQLVNNPEALVIEVLNVELPDFETVFSRETTTQDTFTVIPHYWSYGQLDAVGANFTGAQSRLRQWYYDPRGDVGSTIRGFDPHRPPSVKSS